MQAPVVVMSTPPLRSSELDIAVYLLTGVRVIRHPERRETDGKESAVVKYRGRKDVRYIIPPLLLTSSLPLLLPASPTSSGHV